MKIFRYLKSYVIPIIFIVLLLFVEAICDLALPEYMSNIVNVGIQQSGVSSAVPQKIKAETLDRLELFMSESDIKTVNSFYSEESNSVMTLKADISDKDLQQLEEILINPMMITNLLSLAQSDKLNDKNAASDIGGDLSTLFEDIPQNTDVFTILKTMPKEQLLKISEEIGEKLSSYETLGEDTVRQMVIPYTTSVMQEAGVNTDELRSSYILNAGLIMLGYSLLISLSAICTALLSSVVGAGFARNLRSAVYNKVISFSAKEINSFSTASLITRCTNDIQQIQMVVIMILRMVLYAPIIGIGAGLKVKSTGADMAWVIYLAVGTVLLVVISLMIVALPRFTVLQRLVDRINLVSREILTGIPVIRAFSREKYEEDRFDKANRDLTKTNLFVNRVMTAMMPLMMLIMNGTSILIIWVGADMVDSGSMQVGDLMAYIQYTMQIIMAFLMISMMSIMLPRAAVSGKRISEILKTENSIKNPDKNTAVEFDESKKGEIEFRNVYFRYPQAEEDVLRDISFTASKGETVAFIGGTGSGKSTLINLIPRFYDVTGGKILVDGVDVRKADIHDLRDKIGYVAQKGVLFSGTIASNIAYGSDDISFEQIKKAAQVAQSSDFIEAKEDGYASEIAQGGTNVSGGQKQRLSIARAVAKNPEIYIFDDSFSALDFKTDAALRKALKKATDNATILIVAQRISTVLNADRIVVLDNGEIAGIGTHEELMKDCAVYQQIASSQLSKEVTA